MKVSPAIRWLALAAVLAGGAWIVLTRLSLTYDLAFFLPRPVTQAQHVLIDRVGQGPGARLLFVTLPGADPAVRDALADALRALPEVSRVLPPPTAPGPETIPEALLTQRYLLTDVDTTEAGLRRALSARLQDVAAVDDPGFLALVAADPHLATLSLLESLGAGAGEGGFMLDGQTPFLVLETVEPAFDLGAQQRVLAKVRETALQVTGALSAPGQAAVGAGAMPAATVADSGVPSHNVVPELYGAGAYGLALQAEVRRESTWFSAAAALALGLLLWLCYRSWQAPLLAALPLAAGAVAGLAVLAMLFPAVHGITLAFGFTLMGITVDYAMHVLSHARGGRHGGLARVWPTLALGVISTALAFLAFTLSGSRGLLQLGVFSATGILVAGAFAALLLPPAAARLRAAPTRPDDSAEVRVDLRAWPWLSTLALAALLLAVDPDVWNDDLSSLTPVPEDVLAVDRRLRQQSGAPDIRHLVVSRGDSERAVLAHLGQLDTVLRVQVKQGHLTGFRSVTALVPAPEVQARRRVALDAAGLEQRLAAAAEGLPWRAEAFRPFVEAVRRTASGSDPITAASYRGGPLEDVVSGMLYRDARGWVALSFLHGVHDPKALDRALADTPASTLVDLQEASRSLLATYRERLLQILGFALLAVALVLGLALRHWARWCWVLGSVIASLAVTVALVSRLAGSLSLFDLVAATLVAGLGLDYALFFSRPPRDRAEQRATRHALAVCFASTITVFGLLATSSIPVLHGIGVTVTVGVAAAYALTLAGRSSRPGT